MMQGGLEGCKPSKNHPMIYTSYAVNDAGRFGGLQALQESSFLVLVAGSAGNEHQK
jgi:hypothetical protein